ncbi:hypothetical protein Tco_0304345 [Tanacetum coccineum]
MDDLYNNLKVYEPEVKGMSSLSSSTQNMAFVSSLNNNTSSSNGAVNTAHGVSTASTQYKLCSMGLSSENGNSFNQQVQTTTDVDRFHNYINTRSLTADERPPPSPPQKKNDVKARSMLLMALPNEHMDANTLFAAIQTRFGGNDATKKTQKTLLKQMYENFSDPSTESLDSIFNRL